MKFSEKLIELRKQKGLSQEELGYQINVSRQTVSKWEAEQTSPEVDKVKELSKVFDVSIEYLLNDEIENPKQVTKQLSKKIIKRILIIVLLCIVSIYLATSLFKFIVLLKCTIKTNKNSDYENYSLTYRIVSNDGIDVREYYSTETYYNDITKISYDLPEAEITLYTNLKEKKSYMLRYERETDTYYYKNLMESENYDKLFSENEQQSQTTLDIAKSYIDYTFRDIILYSLDPKVKVSLENGNINIEQKEQNLNTMIVVDQEIGMVLSVFQVENSKYENCSSNEYFDYMFDINISDFPELIEEPDLEGINYIIE